MDELLMAMNNYWNTHEATYLDEPPYKFFEQDDEESRNLETMIFDSLFIGSRWNPDTRKFLSENGYRCWVGDGDSFGILVACITKDGKTFSVG